MASGELVCTVNVPWFNGSVPSCIRALKEQIASDVGIPVVQQCLFSNDGATELDQHMLQEVFCGKPQVVRLVRTDHDEGSTLVEFGKMRGQPYREVLHNKSYCQWMRRVARLKPRQNPPSQNDHFLRLAEYIESELQARS